MKILAVDPGYGRCGLAILEREGGRDVLVYSDCIETAADLDFPERLHLVVSAYEALIRQHAPAGVAMEKLYFSTNRKTAMQVAEVRGALLSKAAEHGLPVHEYTPGEIKSAAAGFGSADKHSVARMLHLLLNITKVIKYDDEYDAIAVGVTHLAHSRFDGTTKAPRVQ